MSCLSIFFDTYAPNIPHLSWTNTIGQISFSLPCFGMGMWLNSFIWSGRMRVSRMITIIWYCRIVHFVGKWDFLQQLDRAHFGGNVQETQSDGASQDADGHEHHRARYPIALGKPGNQAESEYQEGKED